MTDMNLTNGTVRREDWKHTINRPVQKQATKVPVNMIREQKAKYDFTPAVRSETHPLRMPPVMSPTQVDWKSGREYYDRKTGNVRLVTAAEVGELLDWGIDRIRERYPRATKHTLYPSLCNMCRGAQNRFLRTDNACALFKYEQTAWEPMPVVAEMFLIVREPQFAALDAKRIYSAARVWAEEVGAVEFQYGAPTGVDLTPIARKIGYDYRSYGFAKRLKE